ncbi:Prolow-density lipoprotein receptor-related protein 1 [Nymphon striatum]|nr:Prolow-density lipoprotein receptor-related protein 1 [Nymphon striatum]
MVHVALNIKRDLIDTAGYCAVCAASIVYDVTTCGLHVTAVTFLSTMTALTYIAQDIASAVSNCRKLTSKHIGLGLALHQATRSESLVEMFPEANHTIGIDTEHQAVLNALNAQNISPAYIRMLDQIFRLGTSNIKLHNNTNKIRLEKGVGQGDSISPKIFMACLENVFRCLNLTSRGIPINGHRLTNLRFTDDVVLFSESAQELQLMVEELRTASNKVGLEINLSKTKVMFNRNVEIQPIMTGNVALDQVDRYTYLGQLISIHRDWEPEVRRRVALENERILLFSYPNVIVGVDLQKPYYHIIPSVSQPQVAAASQIDFDAKSKKIYWSDTQQKRIRRSALTGDLIETVLDTVIENPYGFGIDWMSGNMFLTSYNLTYGSIYVCNLEGEYIKRIINIKDMMPRSLAIHPVLRKLIWADQNAVAQKIVMANMDGSGLQVLISTHEHANLNSPTSWYSCFFQRFFPPLFSYLKPRAAKKLMVRTVNYYIYSHTSLLFKGEFGT